MAGAFGAPAVLFWCEAHDGNRKSNRLAGTLALPFEHLPREGERTREPVRT